MFTKLIKKEFEAGKKGFGGSKITRVLKSQGYRISQKRVTMIMNLKGWFSKIKKRFKITADSNPKESVCENVLDCKFNVKGLNQAKINDITYSTQS